MTRGMDVEGVRNVINYDMPAFIKTYIHRAGRTARAGQSGRCFTLLSKDEVFFSKINVVINMLSLQLVPFLYAYVPIRDEFWLYFFTFGLRPAIWVDFPVK